ncbi:hypothetical protein JB92DRAFT_3174500 [Gautieria morchelliformis]|nr:hypothetical protein JB92DRAFT_3174500 [Gautieria morchelliformis]
MRCTSRVRRHELYCEAGILYTDSNKVCCIFNTCYWHFHRVDQGMKRYTRGPGVRGTSELEAGNKHGKAPTVSRKDKGSISMRKTQGEKRPTTDLKRSPQPLNAANVIRSPPPTAPSELRRRCSRGWRHGLGRPRCVARLGTKEFGASSNFWGGEQPVQDIVVGGVIRHARRATVQASRGSRSEAALIIFCGRDSVAPRLELEPRSKKKTGLNTGWQQHQRREMLKELPAEAEIQ